MRRTLQTSANFGSPTSSFSATYELPNDAVSCRTGQSQRPLLQRAPNSNSNNKIGPPKLRNFSLSYVHNQNFSDTQFRLVLDGITAAAPGRRVTSFDAFLNFLEKYSFFFEKKKISTNYKSINKILKWWLYCNVNTFCQIRFTTLLGESLLLEFVSFTFSFSPPLWCCWLPANGDVFAFEAVFVCINKRIERLLREPRWLGRIGPPSPRYPSWFLTCEVQFLLQNIFALQPLGRWGAFNPQGCK